MIARDVIAEEIEPAVGVYAPELADAIIARLEASGRSIVHKDEIHAPSVERAIGVVLERTPMAQDNCDIRIAMSLQDAAAALRELMKEVGRG